MLREVHARTASASRPSIAFDALPYNVRAEKNAFAALKGLSAFLRRAASKKKGRLIVFALRQCLAPALVSTYSAPPRARFSRRLLACSSRRHLRCNPSLSRSFSNGTSVRASRGRRLLGVFFVRLAGCCAVLMKGYVLLA
ncbi:hypothetical protein MRX96_001894 [Rhipicephalus microplus]